MPLAKTCCTSLHLWPRYSALVPEKREALWQNRCSQKLTRTGLLPCSLQLRAVAKVVEVEQTEVLEVMVALAVSTEGLEEEEEEMEAQEGQ